MLCFVLKTFNLLLHLLHKTTFFNMNSLLSKQVHKKKYKEERNISSQWRSSNKEEAPLILSLKYDTVLYSSFPVVYLIWSPQPTVL